MAVERAPRPLADVPPPPAVPAKRRLLDVVVIAGVLAVLWWAWEGADMRPLDLWTFRANMAEFLSDFLEPDFRRWELYLEQMIVTVQIAIWGTVLAVVFAVPLSVLCAENVVPVWVYFPIRRLMDAARAINEVVFAVLFVVAVGLGPFAGTLAIFVHTTGVLAKLFSEAVEAIDPRPVEGIRATGGNHVHEVVFGIIPQVMPLWISYALYRFESNVRSATVVGLVGAGGIGQIFFEAFRGFDYAATSAIMIIIIVTVTLLDVASQRLRKLVI
jgi:phosphonate transport system permease protein